MRLLIKYMNLYFYLILTIWNLGSHHILGLLISSITQWVIGNIETLICHVCIHGFLCRSFICTHNKIHELCRCPFSILWELVIQVGGSRRCSSSDAISFWIIVVSSIPVFKVLLSQGTWLNGGACSTFANWTSARLRFLLSLFNCLRLLLNWCSNLSCF